MLRQRAVLRTFGVRRSRVSIKARIALSSSWLQPCGARVRAQACASQLLDKLPTPEADQVLSVSSSLTHLASRSMIMCV